MVRREADKRLDEATQAIGYGKGYDVVSIGDGKAVIPIDGHTLVLRAEYDKGVRAGMLLVVDWPRAFVEFYGSVAKEIREAIEARKESEDGTGED